MKPADLVARLKYMFNIKTGRLLDREGNQYWFFHWMEHRDDGLPSYIGKNGTKKYHKFGELHRDGGLPAIEWADGGKDYYRNGLLHREDGPARERPDGTGEYFLDGKEWPEGRHKAEQNKLDIAAKEAFDTAAKETAKEQDAVGNNMQALKDLKNRRPPPSLKVK